MNKKELLKQIEEDFFNLLSEDAQKEILAQEKTHKEADNKQKKTKKNNNKKTLH